LDDNRALESAIVIADLSLVVSILSALTGGAAAAVASPLLTLHPGPVGRVINFPHIFNVYWSGNRHSWDSNPRNFSTSRIDTFTRNLVRSNYFAGALQYEVGPATFVGSRATSGCGAPTSSPSYLAILVWITCEVQVPGTGVPFPDNNSLYNVWVPTGTIPSDAGSQCLAMQAYHSWSAALTVQLVAGFIPFPVLQDYAYTVLPIDCAWGTLAPPVFSARVGPVAFDNLTDNATHEMIEASTDPLPGTGWIDNSKFNLLTPFFAAAGEAADICEGGAANTKPVRLNGLMVVPYWSNDDESCFPTVRAAQPATPDRAPPCILVGRVCAPPPAQRTAIAAAQRAAIAAPESAIAAATAMATAMPKADAASGIATVMAAARQTAVPAATAIGTAMAAAQQTAVAGLTSTPCPGERQDEHDRC
jgi:hypothetical protein